jgi:programmed cell death 6-interacting protein
LPVPTSRLSTAEANETQKHARALRGLLESLDRLHQDIQSLVQRADALAHADDIHHRIVKVASGFERSAEVVPAMFEPTLDDELAKYDKYIQGIEDFQPRVQDLLDSIKVFLISSGQDLNLMLI